MPPKRGTAREASHDIRITPSDQLPITREEFEKELGGCIEVIACEEGGPEYDKALHYHLYVKAKLAEETIKKICRKLGRQTDDQKGNSVFSRRDAHENSIGYVVKNKHVIYTNNDQTVIEQYFELSDEYRRRKETDRKQEQRKKQKTLKDIVDGIKITPHTEAYELVRLILEEYAIEQLPFPTRSAIEGAVMRKLYAYNPAYVLEYFTKNIIPR